MGYTHKDDMGTRYLTVHIAYRYQYLAHARMYVDPKQIEVRNRAEGNATTTYVLVLEYCGMPTSAHRGPWISTVEGSVEGKRKVLTLE